MKNKAQYTEREYQIARDKVEQLHTIQSECNALNLPQLTALWNNATSYDNLKEVCTEFIACHTKDCKSQELDNLYDISTGQTLRYTYRSGSGKDFTYFEKYEATALDLFRTCEQIAYYESIGYTDKEYTESSSAFKTRMYQQETYGQVVPYSASDELQTTEKFYRACY